MFAKISFAIHLYFCKRKRNRKTVNNMKNTNPIFTLKNFRSFGEDGADFELAPITVLTGCNSAGKSSLVKALMLLSPVKRVSVIQRIYKSLQRIYVLGGIKM